MACIFCEVSVRNAPASFVYNDKDVFAMMSLEQPNPYKVLVLPHAHVESIYDLNDELAASIFQVAAKIACAIRNVSDCDGLNIVHSNGRAGQQDGFHFHLHLVPRFIGDQITPAWENISIKRKMLDQFANEIRHGLT